jgi:NAD dependent epimerase/dehydratase family enzyme
VVVPNVNAEMSFISSADSALALQWLGDTDVVGPINVASPDSVSMTELLSWIESEVGRKALVQTTGKDEDTTRLVGANTRVLEINKATQLGFSCEPIERWLPALIHQLADRLK